jgi:hypothetical protein
VSATATDSITELINDLDEKCRLFGFGWSIGKFDTNANWCRVQFDRHSSFRVVNRSLAKAVNEVMDYIGHYVQKEEG